MIKIKIKFYKANTTTYLVNQINSSIANSITDFDAFKSNLLKIILSGPEEGDTPNSKFYFRRVMDKEKRLARKMFIELLSPWKVPVELQSYEPRLLVAA